MINDQHVEYVRAGSVEGHAGVDTLVAPTGISDVVDPLAPVDPSSDVQLLTVPRPPDLGPGETGGRAPQGEILTGHEGHIGVVCVDAGLL